MSSRDAAPVKTPRAIVDLLNAEIVKAARDAPGAESVKENPRGV